MEDWQDRLDRAREKCCILACQWEKRNGIGYAVPKRCDMCTAKFKCMTMVAKKFVVTNDYSSWEQHIIFASGKDEAVELSNQFYGEVGIMDLYKDGTGDSDISIEEEGEYEA